jgi:hypothetical protein
MSDIWKALPYHLIHNTGLSALLSTRIYPLRLPQTLSTDTLLPAIAFQDISRLGTQAHRERLSLPRPRFQFTIYAGTLLSANAVGEALKACIDGYKGNMGAGSYVTTVEACLLKNEYTNDDTTLDGLVLKYQDYIIQYKE